MRFDPYIDPRLYPVFEASPFVTYDVGASGELYTFFPLGDDRRSLVYGFEPAPPLYESLHQRYATVANVRLFQLALAAKSGRAPLHLYGDVPSNSSLNQNVLILPGGPVASQAIDVEVSTIDEFAPQTGHAPPDFIKLDTEGTEHAILRGGKSTLDAHVLGVQSEIKFVPLSEEGTKFHEIDGLMDELGFVLFDIQMDRSNRCDRPGIGGKKGPIASANVLYLRDFYAYFERHLAGLSRDAARAKLVKLLAVCTKFLYFDYAIELISFAAEKGLLTDVEAACLYDLYGTVTDMSWRVPNFPGKAWLAGLFDFISYVLQPELKLAVPPMYNNFGNRRRALVRRSRPARVRLGYPIRSFTDRNALSLDIDLGPRDGGR